MAAAVKILNMLLNYLQSSEPNVFVTLVVPIVTLLNVLLTAVLGLSEIRKRRAESKNLDTGSDTQMMKEIKQASVDLFNTLKAENKQLKEELIKSESKSDEQEVKITAILSENRQNTNKIILLQTENISLRETIAKLQLKVECLERKLSGSEEDCTQITGKLGRLPNENSAG